MTTTQLDKIVEELKNFPDTKVPSLLDYLHFLKEENEDEQIIEQAEKEIAEDQGVNWRDIQRDV
jgi:hypothetical protein